MNEKKTKKKKKKKRKEKKKKKRNSQDTDRHKQTNKMELFSIGNHQTAKASEAAERESEPVGWASAAAGRTSDAAERVFRGEWEGLKRGWHIYFFLNSNQIMFKKF